MKEKERQIKVLELKRESLLKQINYEEDYFIAVKEGRKRKRLFESLDYTFIVIDLLRDELRVIENRITGLQFDRTFDDPKLLKDVCDEIAKDLDLNKIYDIYYLKTKQI